MAFGRDMDLNHEEAAQQGVLSSLWNMAFLLIKYPIEHPFKAMIYLLWLNMIKNIFNLVYDKYFNEDTVKYPLSALHTAYRGPSFVYVSDTTFDPAKDLVGWTTDRHPSGYYDTENDQVEWRKVTHSFHIEKFSKKDQEGLQKRRSEFYHWCSFGFGGSGYGNILSHRSSCGDMQSTFGFYGDKNLDTLSKFHNLNTGFVVGIRAFGNTEYYSQGNEDKTTYQLVKINLDKIDKTQINFEYNSNHGIVHVYVKDGKVCQHPVIDKETQLSYINNWTIDTSESYLKHLPSFVSTVDWVISARDVPKAIAGEEVENLLDNKKINIGEWQKTQEKISRSPLKNHGIFALPRPSDYDASYEESRFKLKPALLFKIGKEPDVSTDDQIKRKAL